MERIWEGKVRAAMRKQFLNDPIDNYDFHLSRRSEIRRIVNAISGGSYAPSASKRVLQEKSKGLCRQLVIPSLSDALVLQCLSDALYADLRGREPTRKAFFEPQDQAFSQQEDLFSVPEYGSFRAWLNFQQELFRFSSERAYVVTTDIANYYDTIGYVHLRNVIADISSTVREPVLDMLIYVLSGLLWQPDYMPRIEIGLPQLNHDAPRILAHCFLYELDHYLERHHPDFTRFMDDIDIGADTIPEAKLALKAVDLVLQTRHVRLNSGKTQILPRVDALRHFCVRENVLLNALEGRINRRVAAGHSVERERRSISRVAHSPALLARYSHGNGEKILKRVFRIATRIGANLNDDFLYETLRQRPSSRPTVLAYLSKLPMTRRRVEILLAYLHSGMLVDDVSLIHLANSAVETRATSIVGVHGPLTRVFVAIPESNSVELYSKLWFGSKYAAPFELLELIERTSGIWTGDEWLGRLVGGLRPLFQGSLGARLRTLLNGAASAPATHVYDFHELLANDRTHAMRCFNFLRAANESKGTGILHSKYLMALSFLQNTNVPHVTKQRLIDAHSRVWSDVYYRTRARATTRIRIPSTVVPGAPVP